MNKKRMIALLLALVMAAGMLAGCGKAGAGKKQNDKIQISMYLWDRSMLKEFSPWL